MSLNLQVQVKFVPDASQGSWKPVIVVTSFGFTKSFCANIVIIGGCLPVAEVNENKKPLLNARISYIQISDIIQLDLSVLVAANDETTAQHTIFSPSVSRNILQSYVL